MNDEECESKLKCTINGFVVLISSCDVQGRANKKNVRVALTLSVVCRRIDDLLLTHPYDSGGHKRLAVFWHMCL